MFQQVAGGFFQDSTLIGIGVALVGGWLLKRWPAFDNRFIPVATFAVSVITQFINFFQAHPSAPAVHAMVGMPILAAGFFDSSLFKVLITAVLQWVTTDRVYETQKKALVGVQEVSAGVSPAKSKLA